MNRLHQSKSKTKTIKSSSNTTVRPKHKTNTIKRSSKSPINIHNVSFSSTITPSSHSPQLSKLSPNTSKSTSTTSLLSPSSLPHRNQLLSNAIYNTFTRHFSSENNKNNDNQTTQQKDSPASTPQPTNDDKTTPPASDQSTQTPSQPNQGDNGKQDVPSDNKEEKPSQSPDGKSKDDGNWSFLPKDFKSSNFKPTTPENTNFLNWIFPVTVGLFAVSQMGHLYQWYTQRKDRLSLSYHDISDTYLSKNRVEMVHLQGHTATFQIQGNINKHIDVISSPDFAARIAYDAHRFGIENLPVLTSPEIPGGGFLTSLVILSQLALIPIIINSTKKASSTSTSQSPLSSLLKRGKGEKFKKVENITTRFSDVAGMDEAKAEIVEFVDFLKDPKKYEKLGARLPKGALLSGPPGTGKTLLAKATAGEAGVSFYTISGSEFQQMYVGMGSQRVRELFKTARKNAPAIVFIDEIDAIAKQRTSKGRGSGEREATLNQLLVEMDGFNTKDAVVVFAATNRSELLDSALTRAGRFDRKIKVSAPDLVGREQIFNIHLSNLQLAHPKQDVAKKISALTPGMVGADIANVCNEAAIGAARRNNTKVELLDFEVAVDKVVGGLEKKEHLNNQKQRQVVAYHEAGHALMGWFLEHTDPLLKVTIIPRTNGALGFAQYLPKDTGLQQTVHLRDMIAVTLGGRAAEDIVYNKISTGASDDLRQVARITQGMILHYGMSKQFPNTAFATLDEDGQTWKSISEKTNFAIDNEIMEIVHEEYERAKALLTEKRDLLEKLGSELLAKETLNHEQLVAILGPRPFQSDIYTQYMKSRQEFDEELKQEQAQKQ